MSKRIPSMKLSASWSPSNEATAAMFAAVLPDNGGALRSTSGRLHVTYAVPCDMTDVGAVADAAARMNEVKGVLERTGTLHSIEVRPGTSLAEELAAEEVRSDTLPPSTQPTDVEQPGNGWPASADQEDVE